MNQTHWTDIFMAAAIGIISFGIGMNLKFKDFGRVIVNPKAVLTGLFCQMVLLPAIAFLIIGFWPIEPIYKVGFILIAACPGGTMANFVTYLMKGRVPLSVSLTAFNSILILVTIPLIMNLAFWLFMGEAQTVQLSFSKTFTEVLYSVILPVLGGICVNELTSDEFIENMRKPIRYTVSAVLIAVVVVVLWFDQDKQAQTIFKNLHLMFPLLALNVSTVFTGFYFPKLLNLSHKTRYTIAIEVGLQNSALAIFIANKVLSKPDMALMAILYASFSLFTTWGLVYILKYYFNGSEEQQSS